MVVREKLHAFFEREIKGHRVLDILTHRVSKDDRANLVKNPPAEVRAILANITECVTLTAIFLKEPRRARGDVADRACSRSAHDGQNHAGDEGGVVSRAETRV